MISKENRKNFMVFTKGKQEKCEKAFLKVLDFLSDYFHNTYAYYLTYIHTCKINRVEPDSNRLKNQILSLSLLMKINDKGKIGSIAILPRETIYIYMRKFIYENNIPKRIPEKVPRPYPIRIVNKLGNKL